LYILFLNNRSLLSPTFNHTQGQWPFYISLDSGNGMLLGWLAITNEPDQDIAGVLNWFKPGGFTNEIQAVGSKYSFDKGERVLNLTNGYVLMDGGGLAQNISNQFTLEPNNNVKGSNKLTLTITPSSGLFQGAATNALGKTISLSGAVLQKRNSGFGQFLNHGQIGNVTLAPVNSP
jgi:hypothetical protein